MDNRDQGVKAGSGNSMQQQNNQRTVGSQTDFDICADTTQRQRQKASGQSQKVAAATTTTATSDATKRHRWRGRGGRNNGTNKSNNSVGNTTTSAQTDHKPADKGTRNQGTPNNNNNNSNGNTTNNNKTAPPDSCGHKGGCSGNSSSNQQEQRQRTQLQSVTTTTATSSPSTITTNTATTMSSCNNQTDKLNKEKNAGQPAAEQSSDGQRRARGSRQLENNKFNTQSLHSLVMKQQQQNQQLNSSLKPLPRQQQPQQQPQQRQQQLQPQRRQQRHSYSKQELLSMRTSGDAKSVTSGQSRHNAPKGQQKDVVSSTTSCEDDALVNEGIKSLSLNPSDAQSSGRNIIYMTNRVDYEFKARIMIEAVPFRMPNSD